MPNSNGGLLSGRSYLFILGLALLFIAAAAVLSGGGKMKPAVPGPSFADQKRQPSPVATFWAMALVALFAAIGLGAIIYFAFS